MRRLKTSEVALYRAKLMLAQGRKCALCGQTMKPADACLDHDHHSGAIRAVLCRNCNRGEGRVRTVATACKRSGTQLEWLKSLVEYLTKHQYPQTQFLHPTFKTDEEKRLARNKRAQRRRAALKLEK